MGSASTAPVPAGLAVAFDRGGDMGALMRAHDWAATAVGSPDCWPVPLRSAVSMLLASRTQAVMFWGPERVAFYNDAYRPTIGDKHPHALGRPAREHWAELWDVLDPLLTSVERSGESFWGRDHPFRLDRRGFLEETYFDISYDPVRLDDGSVGGVLCIVSETTGRVLSERRLRTISTLGAGLAELTDRSGPEFGAEVCRLLSAEPADVPFALLYLDGALAGACGVPEKHLRQAAMPDPFAGSLHAADLLFEAPESAAERALVRPVLAGGQPVGAFVFGVNRHLELDQPYRDYFDVLADQVSRGVANLRAYEYERDRAAQLAALDRAKNDFFANVSHEFRTPLTLILGPAEDMLAADDLPVQHREPAEVIHRNGQRLLKLVNTLLDFAAIEAGRLQAAYRPTDLSAFTARVASTFRGAAERAGLRLVVDCPPLTAPVYVDRDSWEKVLLNLLSNAVKFTFAGEIVVRVRTERGSAVLTVADTGVGIAPDEVPKLFERFHRTADARARSHEGTGIGLALVRELVTMHGGAVGVSSELGAGSTFTVTVPFGTGHLRPDSIIHRAIDSDPQVAPLYANEVTWWSSGTDSGEAGGEGGHILVADDNSDLRDHLVRLLSPYWRVTAVPDGEAALAAVRDRPFDLVLADVMMPRLDGLGLIARLRADPATSHLPIVLLSARAGDQASVEALAAGADDYLIKPFAAQELVARVRSTTELSRLRGQLIRQLRALADAAVAIGAAQSTSEVARLAAEHGQRMVGAGRVVASIPGTRHEVDAGGAGPDTPSSPVPLVGSGGATFGQLRVWPPVADESGRALLAQLGRLVGLRLENARLYEAEHRIATTLQHSLLPQTLPTVPGAIVASRYLAGSAEADVGGDWYDVIPAGDGELVLVIGDVVGKGVQAAAVMGQIRNALRAYVLEGFDPGAALTRLNRLLGSTGRRVFATAACLRLNPRTGRMRLASAGHPPPLLIDPDGGTALLHDEALGPPVGAMPEAIFPTREGHLDPGARLLLYTDGAIDDRRGGIDAGTDRLRATATRPYDHVEDMLDAVLDEATGVPRRDDIALLAVEATEIDRFGLVLPADPTKLSVLRRRLESFLVAHDVPEDERFDLVVAVSEAAANAIEHPVDPTESRIAVRAEIRGPEVVAVVRDSGQWRDSAGAGLRGRGLVLIGALADLAVDRTDQGTEITIRRVFKDG
jgi:signal transduction histidine kinase/serine phosphatase RsbU (regulator of sigma subunit)/DNA-binding response OmpR family regulator